jgi:hypothetical protein
MREGQKKASAMMKRRDPGNKKMADFLDTWDSRTEWEILNLGFAVWVIQVE